MVVVLRVPIEVVIVFVIVLVIVSCDSTVGQVSTNDRCYLPIVTTSQEAHTSSLCADAHGNTLVYYMYIYICTHLAYIL